MHQNNNNQDARHWMVLPTGNRAFTVIELLVVIAIIMLLAALLLPALGQARESSKKAVCANNLRQIGIIFNLYSDDNDGFFPPVNYATGQMLDAPLAGTGVSFGGWLPGLIPNKKILRCPSYDKRVSDASYVSPVYAAYWPSDPYYFTTYYLVAGCAVDHDPSTSVINGRQLRADPLNGGVSSTPANPRACCPRPRYCGTSVTGYGLGGDAYGPYYVQSPSEQPMATDRHEPGYLIAYYGYGTWDRYFNGNHLGANGENILYVDGHLQWKTDSQITYRFTGFAGLGGAWAYW